MAESNNNMLTGNANEDSFKKRKATEPQGAKKMVTNERAMILRSIRRSDTKDLVGYLLYNGYEIKDQLDNCLPATGYVHLNRVMQKNGLIDANEQDAYEKNSKPVPEAHSLAHIILLSAAEKKKYRIRSDNPGFQFVTKIGYEQLSPQNFSNTSHYEERSSAELTVELSDSMKDTETCANEFCDNSRNTPVVTRGEGTKAAYVYSLHVQKRFIDPEHLHKLTELLLCANRIYRQVACYDNVSVSSGTDL
jgi:hypothetical protein